MRIPEKELMKLDGLVKCTEKEDFVEGLADFPINPKWKNIKTIEFDLTGKLNPSRFLDKIYKANLRLIPYGEAIDMYIAENFQAIHKKYLNICQFIDFKDEDSVKREMSPFAYDKHRKDFKLGMTDDEIKEGIKARLYRTFAGIYTEHYIYLALKSKLGESIRRDTLLDMDGIDIKWGKYLIHVIADTPWAKSALDSKVKNKGAFDEKGTHIVFAYPLGGEGVFSVGNGFKLVKSEYLDAFIQGLPEENSIFSGGKFTKY